VDEAKPGAAGRNGEQVEFTVVATPLGLGQPAWGIIASGASAESVARLRQG